ncbi:hypothetical protein D3871_05435 [Noviherbaspirillum saxi]|uniref:Uncharacterized protein n=1 Tax=Noviherbaspirillum saxi TaxID=2320863 RepID=A0A3A3FPR7_9BURK|nr:hypothetical protein D3871_05435 [Noviherbaspirillum saxi]
MAFASAVKALRSWSAFFHCDFCYKPVQTLFGSVLYKGIIFKLLIENQWLEAIVLLDSVHRQAYFQIE